jgi:hypothetical protein
VQSAALEFLEHELDKLMAGEFEALRLKVEETTTVGQSVIFLLQGIAAAHRACGIDPAAIGAFNTAFDSAILPLATAAAANTGFAQAPAPAPPPPPPKQAEKPAAEKQAAEKSAEPPPAPPKAPAAAG